MPLVQGRGGRTLLCHLFLFLFLLLNNLHPPLTNAREGLVLLRLDLIVQLLVKFCLHLYKKKKMLKREEEKQKKKRKKDDPPSSQVNLLFSSWQIARRMKLEGSSPKQ